MALFDIWIDDTHGVDTRNLLPGDIFAWGTMFSINNLAGTAYVDYSPLASNGTVDLDHHYIISFTGKPGSFQFGPGNGGISGVITSATLSEHIGAGPSTQLAHLSITLGDITSLFGGITVDAALNQTPDTLTRQSVVVDSTTTFAIHGNVGNDLLEGTNSLGDLLDGGHGQDLMIGHNGNDIYVVDNAGDTVREFASEGKDNVRTYTSYSLTPGAYVEVLTTVNNNGTTTINLTGNELSQTIQGNNGTNIIAGGLGTDKLVGLGGNDKFLFDTKPGRANVDTIADYTPGHDHILLDHDIFTEVSRLGQLTPDEFYTGHAAHDANDRIVYNPDNGWLYYDPDGSGGHAAIRFAVVANAPHLSYTDFILV